MNETRNFRIVSRALAAIALIFAVTAPGVALAATTFTSKRPASGNVSQVSTPTISVYVTDRYGVKSATYVLLYVDGRKVKPRIAYKTYRGRRDYKHLTVSYRVTSALKPGRHTVKLRLRDAGRKWAQVIWTFTVSAPAPKPAEDGAGPMPVTIQASDCGACHAGYPAAHPMSDCEQCHGPGRPVSGVVYTPSSVSAHTLSCALTPTCHRSATTFPHVLSSNCASCHASTYTDIPRTHATDSEPAHVSTSTICIGSGCHAASLTLEHYRQSIGGQPLSCATCHASTAPAVVAAMRARPTRCESCHALDPRHEAPPAAHTASGTCVVAGCHSGTLVTIHGALGGPGCTACHAPGVIATADCTSCHAVGVALHAGAAIAHTAPASSCVTALCHGADVSAIHGAAGGPGCAACHAAGRMPATACSSCHTGTMETLHPRVGPAHTAPLSGCVNASCHGTDVTIVHGVSGGPGCAACHASGVTPSVTCSTCHRGDVAKRHTTIGGAHTSTVVLCVTAACHVSDVSAIHAPGAGCIDCHAQSKTPSTVCTACHPATVALAHPRAASSHTAPASTCVAAACHRTDVTALHAALAEQGCPTCHTSGSPATLSCPACHTTGLALRHVAAAGAHHIAPISTCVHAGCHGSDAAALHAGLPTSGCPTCHAPGVTPTLNCQGCHAGDLTSRHSFATTSHTAGASSCVMAGCHEQNASTIHGKAGGPGCAACHAPGKTPSLVCGGCHAQTLHAGATVAHTAPTGTCVQTGCHAANVSKLHVVPGGPSCGACHGPGKTASLACTNCHAGDLTPRHAFADIAHTAPAGACISPACHVPNVASIHAAGLGCVDCHGIGKTPSLLCGTCHTVSPLSLHPYIGTRHTAVLTVCTQPSCHGTDAAAIHQVTGGPGCVACHAAGKTATTTCTVCHTDTASHPAPPASHTAPASSCVKGGCHVADVLLTHAPAGTRKCALCHVLGRTATLDCTQCHGSDVVAAHPNAAVAHQATSTTCVKAGCHAADVAALHAVTGGPGCAACHAASVTASLDCTTCHNATTVHAKGDAPHAVASACLTTGCHAGDAASAHLAGPGCAACHAAGHAVTAACASCHTGDATAVHAPYIGTKHTAALTTCAGAICHSGDVAVMHGVPGGPGCAACHANGVTASLSCSRCHGSDLYTLHPSGTAGHTVRQHPCTDAGCHPADAATTHARSQSSCMACHRNGVATTNSCSTCHPLAWASRHATAAFVTDFHGAAVGNGDSSWGWWSDGWMLPPYTRGMSLPCATCHVPAGTSNIHDFPTTLNGRSVTVTTGTELGNLCVACHGGTVDQWHAGCIACHAGGMGSGGPTTMVGQDCSRCHQHGMQGWPHSIWSFQGATL